MSAGFPYCSLGKYVGSGVVFGIDFGALGSEVLNTGWLPFVTPPLGADGGECVYGGGEAVYGVFKTGAPPPVAPELLGGKELRVDVFL